MTGADLRKLWTVVEALLERARNALAAPSPTHEAAYGALVARYHEYLQHNELELSLDALEELGNLASAPTTFWRDLEQAAITMQLEDRLPGLREKAQEAANRPAT
jgi:hypothetical protein